MLRYVETAATKAVCDALPKPEVLPHAVDLLTRLVVFRGSPLKELPAPLLAAPLFRCLTGADVSLQTLQQEPQWRFVGSRFPNGLLDGSRVLVLSPAQRDILKKLGPKRLEDVTTQLRDEAEVRDRLAGPKQAAEVNEVVAKVKFVREGLHGEVGIPRSAGTRLALTLIKSGLVLETTELAPRYHHAVAAVDCASLSPNARWTGATRDGTFKAVAAEVHEAQRQLAAELVKWSRTSWPVGAELFLLAFLKKELHGFDPSRLDDVTRAVASAPLFAGAHGTRSLLQLKDEVTRTGHFLVLSPQGRRPPVPDDLEVLFEGPPLTDLLGEVLGQLPEEASAALEKLDARRRLEALPVTAFKLEEPAPFAAQVTEGRFTALAALRPGEVDAWVQVFIDRRAYATLIVPCPLPLTVLLDAPTFEPTAARELTEGQRAEVGPLVERAMQAVLQRALEAKDDGVARGVLLLALGRSVDLSLPKDPADALQRRALFPCTDGRVRSFRELDEAGPQYVLSELKGVLPNRRPIVVAVEPRIRWGMRRWPHAEEVDTALKMQLLALQKREGLAPVAEVVSRVESPWRQRLSEGGLTGEVVVAREGAGRLELLPRQEAAVRGRGRAPGAAGRSRRFTAADAPAWLLRRGGRRALQGSRRRAPGRGRAARGPVGLRGPGERGMGRGPRAARLPGGRLVGVGMEGEEEVEGEEEGGARGPAPSAAGRAAAPRE